MTTKPVRTLLLLALATAAVACADTTAPTRNLTPGVHRDGDCGPGRVMGYISGQGFACVDSTGGNG